MEKCKLEYHLIVIMDSSDVKVVNGIAHCIGCISALEGISYEELDTLFGRLSARHPSMMGLSIRTNQSTFEGMQCVIEDLFPGLCVFDPPM